MPKYCAREGCDRKPCKGRAHCGRLCEELHTELLQLEDTLRQLPADAGSAEMWADLVTSVRKRRANRLRDRQRRGKPLTLTDRRTLLEPDVLPPTARPLCLG